ncbi:MAG: SDR family oxidoreductase [Planctomycetota bacterium]
MSETLPSVVLFGASGGIGSETARLLRRDGFGVALVGRSAERLQALATEVDAPAIEADCSSLAEAEQAIAEAGAALGGVDAVVNCIGSLLLKPAHRTTEEEFEAVLRTNLHSAFSTLRAGAAAMKKGGSVVLLSTAAARLGLANHEAIAAAKAGVQGLALSAAASYASRGLRVNVVAPGLIETDMAAPILGSEVSRKASEGMHPLGRIGQPIEVARAIRFLVDPEQAFVTGQVLGVDGGLGTVRSRA